MLIRIFGFVFLAMAATQCYSDAIVGEHFSGTGPYSDSTSGLTGFDADGWSSVGNVGSFSTNGFGESVYGVSSASGGLPSQDGLVRVIGDTDFRAKFEFSNFNLSTNTSSVSLNTFDFTSNGKATVSIQRTSTGYRTTMFYDAGAGFEVAGSLTTQDVVSRATLYLDYSPDLINGGSLYSSYIEYNESGIKHLVGSVDGTLYGFTADANRTMYVAASTFNGGQAYAEFDLLAVSVPEPSSGLFLTGVLALQAIRRRRTA